MARVRQRGPRLFKRSNIARDAPRPSPKWTKGGDAEVAIRGMAARSRRPILIFMSFARSPVIEAQPRPMPGFLSLWNVDFDKLGGLASPVLVLDDFRVRQLPFSPHPHAGFSAVTYVLEDSEAGLRSRTSLGKDIVVNPGGIIWTQAARGILHEESPADRDRDLHGLQIFVNLSSKNKLAPPRVLQLDGSEVPEWRSEARDRVRVVVGGFDGVVSPLAPAERFTLLDVELRREIPFDLQDGDNAIIYVLEGKVRIRADGHDEHVGSEQAMALHGDGGWLTFEAAHAVHFIVLSGAQIREPVVADGPFVMNNRSQIEAAARRYAAGEMGQIDLTAANYIGGGGQS